VRARALPVRFELNFETFQHEKLNNRFAFPLAVDLEPFTKQGARPSAARRPPSAVLRPC
jgi:hypothetical protein